MSFVIIIPARYASTHLSGKPLSDISGKPMIVHMSERARESGVECIAVATDYKDAAYAVEVVDGEVYMTHTDHQFSTECLAEVAEKCGLSDGVIIVNVQDDGPMTPVVIIRQVTENLAQCQVDMVTLVALIHSTGEAFNPSTVRAMLDVERHVLYFSRAIIPWDRGCSAKSLEAVGDTFLRHLDAYGYRAGFIRRYVGWQPSPLKHIEMLEQLRVLWCGEEVHVAIAKGVPGIGADTAEDLERVHAKMH